MANGGTRLVSVVPVTPLLSGSIEGWVNEDEKNKTLVPGERICFLQFRGSVLLWTLFWHWSDFVTNVVVAVSFLLLLSSLLQSLALFLSSLCILTSSFIVAAVKCRKYVSSSHELFFFLFLGIPKELTIPAEKHKIDENIFVCQCLEVELSRISTSSIPHIIIHSTVCMLCVMFNYSYVVGVLCVVSIISSLGHISWVVTLQNWKRSRRHCRRHLQIIFLFTLMTVTVKSALRFPLFICVVIFGTLFSIIISSVVLLLEFIFILFSTSSTWKFRNILTLVWSLAEMFIGIPISMYRSDVYSSLPSKHFSLRTSLLILVYRQLEILLLLYLLSFYEVELVVIVLLCAILVLSFMFEHVFSFLHLKTVVISSVGAQKDAEKCFENTSYVFWETFEDLLNSSTRVVDCNFHISSWSMETPLSVAAYLFPLDEDEKWVGEELLRCGANVNEQDAHGRTSLHWLLYNDRIVDLKAVVLLLWFNANDCIADENGLNPRQMVSILSELDLVGSELIKMFGDGQNVDLISSFSMLSESEENELLESETEGTTDGLVLSALEAEYENSGENWLLNRRWKSESMLPKRVSHRCRSRGRHLACFASRMKSEYYLRRIIASKCSSDKAKGKLRVLIREFNLCSSLLKMFSFQSVRPHASVCEFALKRMYNVQADSSFAIGVSRKDVIKMLLRILKEFIYGTSGQGEMKGEEMEATIVVSCLTVLTGYIHKSQETAHLICDECENNRCRLLYDIIRKFPHNESVRCSLSGFMWFLLENCGIADSSKEALAELMPFISYDCYRNSQYSEAVLRVLKHLVSFCFDGGERQSSVAEVIFHTLNQYYDSFSKGEESSARVILAIMSVLQEEQLLYFDIDPKVFEMVFDIANMTKSIHIAWQCVCTSLQHVYQIAEIRTVSWGMSLMLKYEQLLEKGNVSVENARVVQSSCLDLIGTVCQILAYEDDIGTVLVDQGVIQILFRIQEREISKEDSGEEIEDMVVLSTVRVLRGLCESRDDNVFSLLDTFRDDMIPLIYRVICKYVEELSYDDEENRNLSQRIEICETTVRIFLLLGTRDGQTEDLATLSNIGFFPLVQKLFRLQLDSSVFQSSSCISWSLRIMSAIVEQSSTSAFQTFAEFEDTWWRDMWAVIYSERNDVDLVRSGLEVALKFSKHAPSGHPGQHFTTTVLPSLLYYYREYAQSPTDSSCAVIAMHAIAKWAKRGDAYFSKTLARVGAIPSLLVAMTEERDTMSFLQVALAFSRCPDVHEVLTSAGFVTYLTDSTELFTRELSKSDSMRNNLMLLTYSIAIMRNFALLNEDVSVVFDPESGEKLLCCLWKETIPQSLSVKLGDDADEARRKEIDEMKNRIVFGSLSILTRLLATYKHVTDVITEDRSTFRDIGKFSIKSQRGAMYISSIISLVSTRSTLDETILVDAINLLGKGLRVHLSSLPRFCAHTFEFILSAYKRMGVSQLGAIIPFATQCLSLHQHEQKLVRYCLIFLQYTTREEELNEVLRKMVDRNVLFQISSLYEGRSRRIPHVVASLLNTLS